MGSIGVVYILWDRLPHDLQLVVRGPPRLRKAETPLDALQVLAGDFVAENVGLLVALV